MPKWGGKENPSEVRSLTPQELVEVHGILEKLGGVESINKRLREITCGVEWNPYGLVRAVINGYHIGYSPDNSTRLDQWTRGIILSEYQVMVVGQPHERKRAVIPDSKLDFLFKPKSMDFLQIREGSQTSAMIGMTLIVESLWQKEGSLKMAKIEARRIANEPYKKEYRDTGPMASIPGNPWSTIHGRERDWEGERLTAQYKEEKREETERLEQERLTVVGQLTNFLPLQNVLRQSELRKIIPTLSS